MAKIKKLNMDKGKIAPNFVNCLQTMHKEVAKQTDNQVISKKCIKFQNTCKEDQEDYDEVVSFIKEAGGNEQYRQIGKQLFRIIAKRNFRLIRRRSRYQASNFQIN